jgi:plastocyanin
MRPLAFVFVVAACGGGGGNPPGGDDVPDPDAPEGAAIEETSCGNESASVTSLGTRFDPTSVTIDVGQIVSFEAGNVGEQHTIIPNGAGSTGLEVGEGQTKCFQFNEAGTFGFRCMTHGFVGTVVVE